jgi:hypothetical protein
MQNTNKETVDLVATDDPMMAAEEWAERKCEVFGLLMLQDEAEEWRTPGGRWVHCWDYKIIFSTAFNHRLYLRITDEPTCLGDNHSHFTIYPPDPESFRQVEAKMWEWSEKYRRTMLAKTL